MQAPTSPTHGTYANHNSVSSRLKLSVPSPVGHNNPTAWPLHDGNTNSGQTTPPQPTWSPVTPTLSQADFPNAEQDQLEPSERINWIEEPAPRPLSLDENPDAIALRAAISILQLQRQQSLKDMQALDKMKHAALDDPELFVEHLKQGRLNQPPKPDVDVDDLSEKDSGDEMDTNGPEKSRFTTFPAPQNVVRCPPVNWDKYHIVGESLDKMHEEQRRYPGLTDDHVERSGFPNEHKVATPYRPFLDRLEEKTGHRGEKGS